MLLLGLLDPVPESADNILIDGVRLARFPRSDLRHHLIAMPQDPVFLPSGTSVRQNLDVTGQAPDSICRGALETVGLVALLAHTLDGPLDTNALSEGQKQLFCLARCIVKRRARKEAASGEGEGGLLLLDEVTAHLDEDTADRMEGIMSREFRTFTVLAVTHRMKSIARFSRAFVLDAGRVVEVGAVGELLAREDSHLKKLFEMESSKY